MWLNQDRQISISNHTSQSSLPAYIKRVSRHEYDGDDKIFDTEQLTLSCVSNTTSLELYGITS